MIWNRNKPHISFKSYLGNFAVSTPVLRAIKVRVPWMTKQTPETSYARCPGMSDYATSGYVLTAHTDIHIKANSAGVVVQVTPMACDSARLQPTQFDFKLVDGMTTMDGVKAYAGKIPLPWTIQARKGYSAYYLPPLMHADYLDKIFVYPGIVDCDAYHTVNFVFSPIKECEFTIAAGTPLLHIIPFKRENIVAECDKATIEETDRHLFNFVSKVKHFYRKYFHGKKSYTMKCPYTPRVPLNEE